MARPQAPRGEGRARVIAAAQELFAERGISGTSLQNIADHMGVQKAAVYYQFKTKEDIVLAVLEPAHDALQAVVDASGRESSSEGAADTAIMGLVDLIVDQREAMATLYGDPEAQRLINEHPTFKLLIGRLGELILGPDPSPARRVATTVFGAGMAQAATDPGIADIPPEDLREILVALGRTMLGPDGDRRIHPRS
jgi:AcrR family transcriptional regulator